MRRSDALVKVAIQAQIRAIRFAIGSVASPAANSPTGGEERLITAMHPPLSLHKHPMCAETIELFQKCHTDHPLGKFLGQCTDLKIQLDRCFRQEKAVKRKANFEESKKLKERLQAFRKEQASEENIQG